MTDLEFLTDGAAPANPAAPPPRKCYRHDWRENRGHPYTDAAGVEYAPGDLLGHLCARCGKVKADAATISRVRRASARGFRTSADLAAYLGGQNVDKLGWPWDVQGRGYRIQSKRDKVERGATAYARLIDAIPAEGDYLRAVYHVPPAARLTSGVVLVRPEEWDQWHDGDWTGALFVSSRLVDLLQFSLPTFRDLHIGSAA